MAIFIHIPRTAGTAICNTFNLDNYHATASMRKANLGDAAWAADFKFVIIRNPWAQIYSFWKLHKAMSLFEGNFQDWLRHGLVTHYRQSIEVPDDPMDQYNYIHDKEGNLLVDLVVKFEEIQQQMPLICEHLGVASRTLPAINGTGAKWDHQQHYPHDLRMLVANRYPKFISTFGYEF